MPFDPAVSHRIAHNERLQRATGWADYRDLRGALALTSDAPVEDLNCLEAFSTNERHLEMLLDIGFSLLRAFDRPPAVQLTPLDRPRTIARHLRQRGLVATDHASIMAMQPEALRTPRRTEVAVRVAEADDARTFADIVAAGDDRWVRRLMLSTMTASMHDPAHIFYLGNIDGRPVGTTHLFRDGATAGLYSVGTLRAYRRRGVASALIARALRDARAAGCDVIGLRTFAGSDAERLYAALGFERAHEAVLWTTPR